MLTVAIVIMDFFANKIWQQNSTLDLQVVARSSLVEHFHPLQTSFIVYSDWACNNNELLVQLELVCNKYLHNRTNIQ